jgi:hypothetical protein
VYGAWSAELVPTAHEVNVEPRLTVSVDGLPLPAFARWVADKAGVSIVIEDTLETRKVTLDVRDVAVSDLLGMVARRADSQVTRVGRLFYLGQLRPEDKGVLVRKVGRLSGEELSRAVGVLLSEYGRCQCFADGLVLVGDRVEVLQRVDELLNGVESAAASTWVVQLYVVNLSNSDVADLGLDALPALEVAATVAGVSGGGIGAASALASSASTAARLKGGLDLVLRASRVRSSVVIVGQPLFLMVDGDSTHLGSGQRVPVPRRTVSDQGTVTTAGFDYIDTGLQLDVELREVAHERARLRVKGSFSSVLSFVEAAPVVSRDDYASSAVIASGGVYLVSSLERTQAEKAHKGPLSLGLKNSDVGQVVQIWARAYRIAGPAGSAGGGALSGAAEQPVGPSLPVVQVPEVQQPARSPAADGNAVPQAQGGVVVPLGVPPGARSMTPEEFRRGLSTGPQL